MNIKVSILLVLLLGVFLVGCASGQNGYATYNQPGGGGQPSGQYVGGGCGVAPAGDYGATQVGDLGISGYAL